MSPRLALLLLCMTTASVEAGCTPFTLRNKEINLAELFKESEDPLEDDSRGGVTYLFSPCFPFNVDEQEGTCIVSYSSVVSRSSRPYCRLSLPA
eukprot:m.84252 g.84252  ORF g.84252 m.84252 type:complete len:94 (+) comp36395_c0_seq5:54-335(+)